MIDLDTIDLGSLELTMQTSKGDMAFRFFHEEAPGHSRNIAKLAMATGSAEANSHGTSIGSIRDEL